MSLTEAASAMAVNLYGLHLGRRTTPLVDTDAPAHRVLIAFRLVTGALITGACWVMVGFLAFAALESLSASNGRFSSVSGTVDQAIDHHGYHAPHQPRALGKELPALAVLNPVQIQGGVITPPAEGMTIVAEGAGYCLSTPDSGASLEHYHSSTRRTDIIPCH
jgi:hypothetical protein